MLRGLQTRITYANVVASLALFIALGGVSWAAIKLPAKSVGTKQLRKGAVTGAKVHKNAITSRSVADGSLLARDFAAGQLTAGARGDAGSAGPAGAAGAAGQNGAAGSGETLKRTITVRGDRTPAENGAALLAAKAGIDDGPEWLLKLDPGIYDLGTASLNLNGNVDLEGSGTASTVITSDTSSGTIVLPAGTIRLVGVRATGTDPKAIATATGAVLDSVAAKASGPGVAIALDVSGPTHVFRSDLQGLSQTAGGIGIAIQAGYATTVVDTTVTATATGAGSQAIAVSAFSLFTAEGSTLFAAGSSGATGVGQLVQGGVAEIDGSEVGGSTAALRANNGPIKVGASKLNGGVATFGTGTLVCAASYNASYAPVGAACT
jgi:hypothetical protein